MGVGLEIRGLVKTYPAGVRVGPISLTVNSGEFFSLLGPSGCGKTTTLRCIAGFESISEGSISLDGQRLDDKPPHRRGVGLVFQDYALFPHLTVHDNVAFGLKLRKRPKREIGERVERALATVSLSGVGNRYPAQLSGGQQQRVAIARALVLEPGLLLMDEPLSNLDLKLRVQMRYELRRLQRQLGTTSVYVTHDQTEALALSDRIAVLSNGHVVQVGTPAEIYGSPATTFVADFVGSSNMVKGTVASVSDDRCVVSTEHGLTLRARANGAGVGAPVTLMVRPERIVVGASDGPPEAGNLIHAALETVTFLGEDLHLAVRTATNLPLLVAMKNVETTEPFRPGATLALSIDPADVHVLSR